MLRHALVVVSPLFILGACSSSPPCLDAGVDGGGCGTSGAGGGAGQVSGTIDPHVDHAWDLVLESFNATAEVSGLSYSDSTCSATGGPASATFTATAAAIGTKIGSILWSADALSNPGSFDVSAPATSNATMGAQTGTSTAGPAHCDAHADPGVSGSYTVHGKFAALTGNVTMTAGCPIDPIIGGNIGCPPNGDLCRLHFGFDNTAVPHSSDPFSIDTATSGSSFTISFSGTGTTMQNAGATTNGNYTWSGSMKLHAVPRP
jgi:hypothetical protein